MTTPTMNPAVDTATPVPAPVGDVGVPPNAAPVALLLCVEGMDTGDGRHLTPGGLTVGPLPLPIFGQTRSTHGDDGDAATWHLGSLTRAWRVPGPDVTQLSTGQPFPEGTFVWLGEGWIYTDVPAAPDKSAYTLVRDGALRGNSVDLTTINAVADYDDEGIVTRIEMESGVIAATTIVGMPAFPDMYITLTADPAADQADDGVMPEATPIAAGGVPAWRSSEFGDDCAPCALGFDLATDDAPTDTGDAPVHQDGMIALIPVDPAALAVPGGDPADTMHLTLAYLGDDVTANGPEWAQKARSIGAELAATTDAPIEGRVMGHAQFNPTGGPDSQEPCAVYLVGDAPTLGDLRGETLAMLTDLREVPEQYQPFIPHITAGYGLDVGGLTFTGPIVFDKLRVALGGENTDYPLGQAADVADKPDGEDVDVVVASATPPPPAAWFTNPGLDAPTPHTVTPEGRVYGHLAAWGTCHIGFQGQCITPPRSASNYAGFLVHSVQADDNGTAVTLPVGYGTIGTGHANMAATSTAAAAHYDNTGTAAFEITVGEDDHGIWYAGRLMPGLDDLAAHKAKGTVFSGDWRNIGGNLELVAALGVNTPGFPVPRVRVASGAPVALVASGVVPATPDDEDDDDTGSLMAWLRGQKTVADQTTALAVLDAILADAPDPAAAYEALFADLDQTTAEPQDYNWVDDVGGLPRYIKKIEKALEREGHTESSAIAIAVEQVKKLCAKGNAQACSAVAEWEEKRARANAD